MYIPSTTCSLRIDIQMCWQLNAPPLIRLISDSYASDVTYKMPRKNIQLDFFYTFHANRTPTNEHSNIILIIFALRIIFDLWRIPFVVSPCSIIGVSSHRRKA